MEKSIDRLHANRASDILLVTQVIFQVLPTARGQAGEKEHRSIMRVEESIEINRPLDEVFNYVSDVANFPHWTAHTLEVRKDTPGPPQEGDGFTVAIKSVGRRFETPYERAAYEPNRRYTDRAVGGPIPNQQWDYTFEEVPEGTRLRRAVEAEAGGFLRLVEPLQKRAVKRQLRKDLQTLKDLLEAR